MADIAYEEWELNELKLSQLRYQITLLEARRTMSGMTATLDQNSDSDIDDDHDILSLDYEQPSRPENPQLNRMARIIAKNRGMQLEVGLERGFSTQELMDALPKIIVESCK